MSAPLDPLHRYYYRPLEDLYLPPERLEKHLQSSIDKTQMHWGRFGSSAEGRPLHKIEWGEGAHRILFWAQMHGNESTATKALIDLFQLLQKPQKEDQEQVARWRQQFKLCFIPQLNPDGAERFTRRNAQLIDLNRDARARESPEMQAFFQLLDGFDPHWCFNLHDQRSIFSASPGKPATLSFLAASADPERKVTPVRLQAMQLIAAIHHDLQALQPGCFGRYTDVFYPKATGDLLQSKGRPTLLFECGAFPADPERRMARCLTFKGLRAALQHVLSATYQKYRESDYLKIPLNGQNMRDLIIRNCSLAHARGRSRVDLALRLVYQKAPHARQLEQHWVLDDLGDLSHLSGYQERTGGAIEVPENLILNNLAHFHLNIGQKEILFKNGLWII